MAAKKKEEYKQQITDSLLKALAELNTEKLINSDPGLKEMSDRWDKADDLNIQAYDNYKSGNYIEGIELAQTAYSLVEKSYILDTLAEGYYSLKQYQKALETADLAIKKDKLAGDNIVDHYFTRAKIHLAMENINLAKKDFEKVLEIDPDHEEAKVALNKIK
ncbi:hypothetical protein N8Z58_01120 [Flavobacteriaceae bacterium]|nr:hypothetical protein [Flavobacteriaceae bacterium]